MRFVPVYAKLDMAHPDYSAAIAAARARFDDRNPGNTLSVNAKADGSVCWVKLTADDPEEIKAAAAPFAHLILDSAIGRDEHDKKVLPDVRSPDWYPPDEDD